MTSKDVELPQTEDKFDGEDRKVDGLSIDYHDTEMDSENKYTRGDISPFRTDPGFWDGLLLPKQPLG